MWTWKNNVYAIRFPVLAKDHKLGGLKQQKKGFLHLLRSIRCQWEDLVLSPGHPWPSWLMVITSLCPLSLQSLLSSTMHTKPSVIGIRTHLV